MEDTNNAIKTGNCRFANAIRRFKLWWKSKNSVDVDIISADTAYCKATYGEKMTVQTLIKMHQSQINSLINDKTQSSTNGYAFTDYHCVYSFPNDIEPYIGQILSVFVEKGYKVINLSEKVEEIQNEHVYLISWYKKNI